MSWGGVYAYPPPKFRSVAGIYCTAAGEIIPNHVTKRAKTPSREVHHPSPEISAS